LNSFICRKTKFAKFNALGSDASRPKKKTETNPQNNSEAEKHQQQNKIKCWSERFERVKATEHI